MILYLPSLKLNVHINMLVFELPQYKQVAFQTYQLYFSPGKGQV